MIMLQKIMAVAARPLFSLPTPTLFRTKPLLHFNHHHYLPRFSFERTPPVLVRSVTSTSAAPPLTDAPSRNSIEVDLKPYLSCSMPESPKPLKVAVLLSGGVDSSVALRLLHAAGHSCTAFYLKIWFQEDFENFWSECPWDEDLKHAQAVCEQVDVILEVVHLSEEYWSKVGTDVGALLILMSFATRE